jgi:GWxTD domain-containing protein
MIMIGTFVCLAFAAEADSQKTALPAQYEKWLDEEVVYIITPLERDVFLKLQTDRERDLFIEAFWKHRDPAPGTPVNEFRTEHARRVNYANRYYGRSSPLPGWKTDRGRMYIILGEPNDIQRIEGRANVYPCEIWFYQDKVNLGLPTGFNLVFFKESGQGDFRLYSPAKDGPQALLVGYSRNPNDYLEAYQALREIEPALADVSLSLIPGENFSGFGRPTLASDILIQKIEDSPRNQVEERYAQRFLQYKDIVDVEYTANYLDSDTLVKITKESSGTYFVHYAIEPKQLSVNMNENKFYTTLKINGAVTSLERRMIYQFDKSIAINLDETQMKAAGRQPFDLLDMFPLIPGTYKLSILVKNEVSKEFTSLEQTLLIPGETPVLQMTSPILGYKTARANDTQKGLKPFRVGGNQIYCQPGRVFSRKDTLAVAFQVLGLNGQQKQSGQVRYVLSRNGQTALEKNKNIIDYGEVPNILEEFPLIDFVPAHYDLRISIFADGGELVAGTEEFDVSNQEVIPRPWFSSKVMPEAADPIYAQLIGIQLFNSGRAEEAKGYLEKVYQQKPDSADTALALARVYVALKEFSKILPVLSPFLSPPQPPKYEIYFICGQINENLGDYAKALEIYNQTVSHFGINANLLNSIGKCNLQLGRPKEALAAWEKSLEINRDQPDIKKKVEALREKKSTKEPS